MSHIEDRPTIAERYSTSIEASNLKVNTDTRGPIDVIIAAGWSGDGIGATLVRLRAEFDTVRADLRGKGDSALTDKLLTLMHLKSLPGAKQEIGRMGLEQATLSGFVRPEREIMVLVGHVIDAWLDPLCEKCGGRGFNGGGRLEHSGPQMICRGCGGTGSRKAKIAQDDDQARFVSLMFTLIDRAISAAESRMGRLLFAK